MNEFTTFGRETLVPAAQSILLESYEAHRQGRDLDIRNKADGTPASRADRVAEQTLRRLIKARYPDHGIIGEEEGSENPDARYVWVLDPLDGTREFLALQPGWGTLIALLEYGRPIAGIIHDSLRARTWYGQDNPPLPARKNLAQAAITSTAPGPMFAGTKRENAAARFFSSAAALTTRRNCLGFAEVADGTVDLACEAGLKLHDIAALLPVLWAAGAKCTDLAGNDYAAHVFNLAKPENDSYELLCARDPFLLQEALAILKETA